MIVRVVKPEAFKLPEIRALFLEALLLGKDPERSVDKLAERCTDPRVGIFVGLEKGEPRACLSIIIPNDPRTDRPLVDLGTNRGGSPALKREMLAVGLAYMRAAGYNQAWFFNGSGHSDKAYLRTAKANGLEARVRCSLIEIDF